MEERSGGDGRDAAAAERHLTLVEAAVADRGQADDQPAAEVPDACADHRPVFPPCDAHFDERSGGGEMKGVCGGEASGAKKDFLNVDSYSVSRLHSAEGAAEYICHSD